MSKTGEQGKVVPPLLDEDGNPIVGEDDTNTKISTTPTLQELMRRLEELTAENKKHRAKAKNKKAMGNSFSSEEEDSSFEEDIPKREKKGKRKGEEIEISLPITQCLSIMIIYLILPLILSYPLAKLPTLMDLVTTNESIA
jgi:hypothetical protein